MAPPTRGQIEAVNTEPTYQLEYWNGSAWVAVTSAWVLDGDGAAESAGGANGVTFGAETTASLTIRLDPLGAGIAWQRTPVRLKYGFSTSDLIVRATGVISTRSRSDKELIWQIDGFNEPIARTAVYSPLFYRRPAATLTSATSIEDPTNGAYKAGLVNYILWAAGGRPSEQSASYPTALFYYRCDFAPITPEWSWAAGENAWDELGRLARACGLVIYQAADGVVTATSALALGGTAAFTFVEPEGLTEDASTGELVGAVRCAYTTRRLQPRQVVYEDSLARQIVPGGSGTYTLDMQQPVYDVEATSGALPADAVSATTTEGKLLTMSAAIVSQSAARLTITVTNPGTETMVISRIQIRGRPIAVVEEGSVTVGSGLPEREVGSDTGVYVQSQFHAERLCTLYRDINGAVLPTRTISNWGYDPDRSVGEIVGLTKSAWGLSAAPHRITAIRHHKTGAVMDVDLVPSATLPTPAGTFIIGTSYSGGDVRLLSY
jgi:hypothetical protein